MKNVCTCCAYVCFLLRWRAKTAGGCGVLDRGETGRRARANLLVVREFRYKLCVRPSTRALLWLPLIQKRQHILRCHRPRRLKLPVFLAEQQFAVALQQDRKSTRLNSSHT